MVPYSDTEISIPNQWDSNEVARVLQRHQDNPAVLSYAVSSIKSRMILGQHRHGAGRCGRGKAGRRI